MNRIELTRRHRRKLQNELKQMQLMWIKQNRLTESQIEMLKDEDLVREIHMTEEWWSKYNNKPKLPELCIVCHREKGKAETNEKCFDCLNGDAKWFER